MPKVQRYWLSFANEETGKNLGVTVVDATSLTSAIRKAHELGANPGGQVLSWQMDDPSLVPDDKLNRLMTKEECASFIGIFSTRKDGS